MSEEAALARPYVHLLDGRDPEAVMRETPAKLAEILKLMSTEHIEYKPAPHKWSVREILCHLTDCEISWAWRLRSVFGEDNPTLQPFEQDAWAKAYDGPGYTTSSARATWIAVRQWNMALIERLSDEDKQRPATHPELGSITLWNMVEIIAGHDLHHVNSLEKVAHRPMQE